MRLVRRLLIPVFLTVVVSTPFQRLAVAALLPTTHALLDINTATLDELKALPGMGPAYAARVIKGRPYTAKNQLALRGILPDAAYARIKDQIIAHRPK